MMRFASMGGFTPKGSPSHWHSKGHGVKHISWRGVAVALLGAVVILVLVAFFLIEKRAPESLTRKGKSLVNSKDYPGAIEAFNRAIEIEPSYAPAFHGRGVAFARQGDMERALADFDEAIRLDPAHARAYLDRGKIHQQKGDAAKALSDRQKALELDPALGTTDDAKQ